MAFPIMTNICHDFKPNATYNEAKIIGAEFKRIGKRIVNLKKKNSVAVLFSNEALTALNTLVFGQNIEYNDLLRKFYDPFYKLNIECDFIDPSCPDFEKYKLIVVPGLYATSDELLEKLNRFVEVGGHVLFSLRSGFCDENIKVRAVEQPGIIGKACGVYYNQFVNARGLKLKDHGFELDDESQRIYNLMELLIPQEGTEVLAVYDHCYWGEYAAITRNTYGRGSATYVGCIPSDAFMLKLVKKVAEQAGLFEAHERLEFPLITRKGTNDAGRRVHFYFNYSNTQQEFTYQFSDAEDLSQGIFIKKGDRIVVEPWDFVIIEE